MKDILDELDAVHREVGRKRIPAGEARTVVLRRSYDATMADVWDAITNPDRLPRWFLPVSGDLRPGGSYQLEGNAGGTIVRCEPPRRLAVTWIYGEQQTEADISEVEVRLSTGDDGRTVLHLEHAAVVGDHWQEFGPGAAGVGWDLALLGLIAHLRGEPIGDPAAFDQSAEGRQFMTESSRAWGAAHEAAGASSADAARAATNTANFYAPAPDSAAGGPGS